MMILSDKVLAQVGLDFATAVGLLAPADETIVHVRQELGPDDGGTILPLTQEGQTGAVEPVPTIPPTIGLDEAAVGPLEHLRWLDDGGADLRGDEYRDDEDRPAHRMRHPVPVAQVELPPQVEQYPQAEHRMHSLAELELQAAKRRMTLVYTGSVFALQSSFGTRFYSSLDQVSAAMKTGRYD